MPVPSCAIPSQSVAMAQSFRIYPLAYSSGPTLIRPKRVEASLMAAVVVMPLVSIVAQFVASVLPLLMATVVVMPLVSIVASIVAAVVVRPLWFRLWPRL